ncbi:cupin-like domain-containing protein [Lysobacter cavernae]|uniref:Cupin-like domain-containing protein n=1 Tax=Lysobacter cavernae TaxID=1685901 RepID=A0ABV7RMH2_9GAMM
MATERRPLIDIDTDAFHPWRIQPVRHHLCGHPLLQPASLVELGARLEARGSIRSHGNDATAGTPFNDAPNLHPNRQSAAQTLQSIEAAKAWMSLLNVQIDPIYRELVGTVLDSVRPQVEPRDPGMCHRAGWIFVSSPRTVTPFHFDKEHNFILQLRGHKRVYVWDHRDTVVASEQARDRFHHRHERDLLRWRDEFRERAQVFDLEPGQGAYMPSTSPHMVENGDEPSITMSFTYYTQATRRDALLHKLHALMRSAGIAPPAVGQWPLFDTLTHTGVASMISVRGFARSLAGRHAVPGVARFADVLP